MERGDTILFYLCGNCQAVNLLPKLYEEGLIYTTTIRCNECDTKLSREEMDVLKRYSKYSRPNP